MRSRAYETKTVRAAAGGVVDSIEDGGCAHVWRLTEVSGLVWRGSAPRPPILHVPSSLVLCHARPYARSLQVHASDCRGARPQLACREEEATLASLPLAGESGWAFFICLCGPPAASERVSDTTLDSFHLPAGGGHGWSQKLNLAGELHLPGTASRLGRPRAPTVDARSTPV